MVRSRSWWHGEDGGGAAVRTKMVDSGRRWRRVDGGTAGWFVVAVASPAMV